MASSGQSSTPACRRSSSTEGGPPTNSRTMVNAMRQHQRETERGQPEGGQVEPRRGRLVGVRRLGIGRSGADLLPRGHRLDRALRRRLPPGADPGRLTSSTVDSPAVGPRSSDHDAPSRNRIDSPVGHPRAAAPQPGRGQPQPVAGAVPGDRLQPVGAAGRLDTGSAPESAARAPAGIRGSPTVTARRRPARAGRPRRPPASRSTAARSRSTAGHSHRSRSSPTCSYAS